MNINVTENMPVQKRQQSYIHRYMSVPLHTSSEQTAYVFVLMLIVTDQNEVWWVLSMPITVLPVREGRDHTRHAHHKPFTGSVSSHPPQTRHTITSYKSGNHNDSVILKPRASGPCRASHAHHSPLPSLLAVKGSDNMRTSEETGCHLHPPYKVEDLLAWVDSTVL